MTEPPPDNPVARFIVSNYLFGDESRLPHPASSLMESGVIDSTGILELIEFLESTFDIEVSEQETVPQNLDSIDRIQSFVDRKTAGI